MCIISLQVVSQQASLPARFSETCILFSIKGFPVFVRSGYSYVIKYYAEVIITLLSKGLPFRYGLQQTWFHMDVSLKSHTNWKAVLEVSLQSDHAVLLQCAKVIFPGAYCCHRLVDQFVHLLGSSLRVVQHVLYVGAVPSDPVSLAAIVVTFIYYSLDLR